MSRSWLFSVSEMVALLRQLLMPSEICQSVEHINIDQLQAKGIKTLLIDIDNTLLTYSETQVGLQKVNWIQMVKSMGFEIILVTNNSRVRRVRRVCQQLELPGVCFALKPFTWSVREFCRVYQVSLSECAVIGDQMFTDIIFGNWIRAHSILVDPLDKRLSFVKTVQREIELFLIKKLKHKRSSYAL